MRRVRTENPASPARGLELITLRESLKRAHLDIYFSVNSAAFLAAP
jgi:hypothetical protein